MANWGQVTYVRFGSLAVVHHPTSRTSAFGCIPDVRFGQKPIFDSLLSANSGHGKHSLYVTANANDLAELRQLYIRIQGGVRVGLCEKQ